MFDQYLTGAFTHPGAAAAAAAGPRSLRPGTVLLASNAWSNAGQTLVKHGSDTVQILVKRWSNTGQTPVSGSLSGTASAAGELIDD